MMRGWAVVFGAYWAILGLCWWFIAKTHNLHQYRWMSAFIVIAVLAVAGLIDAWLARRRAERGELHR